MTQYQSEVTFRGTGGEVFLQLILRGSTIQVISMLMIAVSGRRPQDTLPHAPSGPPFPLQLQNPDTGNSRGPRPTLTVQPAKWTMASTPCLHSRAPANSHHCLVLPSTPSCEVGITIPVCREASCIAEGLVLHSPPHPQDPA